MNKHVRGQSITRESKMMVETVTVSSRTRFSVIEASIVLRYHIKNDK